MSGEGTLSPTKSGLFSSAFLGHIASVLTTTGYFVSTVGITEEIIRRYVARQGKEDAGQAQLEF
jgi:hypothetical protein